MCSSKVSAMFFTIEESCEGWVKTFCMHSDEATTPTETLRDPGFQPKWKPAIFGNLIPWPGKNYSSLALQGSSVNILSSLRGSKSSWTGQHCCPRHFLTSFIFNYKRHGIWQSAGFSREGKLLTYCQTSCFIYFIS